jgi:hypothetical protein
MNTSHLVHVSKLCWLMEDVSIVDCSFLVGRRMERLPPLGLVSLSVIKHLNLKRVSL